MKFSPGFSSSNHSGEKTAAPSASRVFRVLGRIHHLVRERLIEFWLTLRLLLTRLRHRRPMIVLFRDLGIGDLVCTFPVIAEFRRKEPGNIVVYVTLPRFRDFVREFSGADVVLGSRFVHYNRAVPRLPAWMARKVLVPRYEGERGLPASFPRSSYSREMAKSCGIVLDSWPGPLEVDRASALRLASRFQIDSLKRPIVGFHAGPSAPVREWPLPAWQRLIELLHGDLNASVIRFGSAWHHTFQANAEAQLASDLDLTDRLSLVATAELISTIDLFIGIDSGLLHIARAVGTPVIGLFGPTDPAIVLGDRDSGAFTSDLPCLFCQHRNLNLHWNTNCPYDIQCMKLLTPEMVFAKVKRILLR